MESANEPTPEPPLTCEECFTENLTQEQLANFEEFLVNSGLQIKVGNEAIIVHSVANLCGEMENDATIPELIVIFAQIGAILFDQGIELDVVEDVQACLEQFFFV